MPSVFVHAASGSDPPTSGGVRELLGGSPCFRTCTGYLSPLVATPSMIRVRKAMKTISTGNMVMTQAAMIPP